MNQYRKYPGIGSDINRPQHRIAQQCLLDSLIMVALINGEPTQQQDWQRVGHVAPHRLGCSLMADRTGGQAVVTNNIRTGTQNKVA